MEVEVVESEKMLVLLVDWMVFFFFSNYIFFEYENLYGFLCTFFQTFFFTNIYFLMICRKT